MKNSSLPSLMTKSMVSLVLLTMLNFCALTTEGLVRERSFKRTVMDGFELTGDSVLGSQTQDGLTVLDCGAFCASRNCIAYSFRKRGSVGMCRIGMNPHSKARRKRSRIYYVIDDSDPNASDGFKYTMIVAASTPKSYVEARAYCLGQHGGNLALTYPSQVTYRQLVRLNTTGIDNVHVDLHRLGPYTERKFISGVGEIMEAGAGALNSPSQRWASGEPNANTDADGSRVMLSLDTGHISDMSTASTMSKFVCSNDTTSYRYLPETGKYYKFTYAPKLTHPAANRSCKADGGRLALTYGINGLFPVMDAYKHPIDLPPGYWVGGTNAASLGSIWTFEDGTTINSANKGADTLRQRWEPTNPNAPLDQNCLLVFNTGQWGDAGCSDLQPYLCERDFP